MQSHRFMTELWADGAPKLRIMSSSSKSVVEQERLDRPYSSCIAEENQRIARAGAPVRFEQGSHRLFYWTGLIVFTGIVLGLLLVTLRALQFEAKAGAALIAVIGILFVWRGGNFLRCNRPGVYRPEALPAQLTPGG